MVENSNLTVFLNDFSSDGESLASSHCLNFNFWGFGGFFGGSSNLLTFCKYSCFPIEIGFLALVMFSVDLSVDFFAGSMKDFSAWNLIVFSLLRELLLKDALVAILLHCGRTSLNILATKSFEIASMRWVWITSFFRLFLALDNSALCSLIC